MVHTVPQSWWLFEDLDAKEGGCACPCQLVVVATPCQEAWRGTQALQPALMGAGCNTVAPDRCGLVAPGWCLVAPGWCLVAPVGGLRWPLLGVVWWRPGAITSTWRSWAATYSGVALSAGLAWLTSALAASSHPTSYPAHYSMIRLTAQFFPGGGRFQQAAWPEGRAGV